MKQSDALQLVAQGTLIRPGPLGRSVRLIIGLLCLYVVFEIIRYWGPTSHRPIATLDERVLILLAPLCVTNYVINIGFTKSWGRRPLMISVLALIACAAVSALLTGKGEGPILGVPLNLWLIYFYGHLGTSFVLAAVLGTPGCEMRAIPELLGRARGEASEEHHCPAAFITKIDEWEKRRRS